MIAVLYSENSLAMSEIRVGKCAQYFCGGGLKLVKIQKQPSRGVLRKRCSPVNLLHIFRTLFPKNTSEGLLLNILELAKIEIK